MHLKYQFHNAKFNKIFDPKLKNVVNPCGISHGPLILLNSEFLFANFESSCIKNTFYFFVDLSEIFGLTLSGSYFSLNIYGYNVQNYRKRFIFFE